jgi:hypothetical protein
MIIIGLWSPAFTILELVIHHGAEMADSFAPASVAPATPTVGAGAQKPKAEQTPETDTEGPNSAARDTGRAAEYRVDLVAAEAIYIMHTRIYIYIQMQIYILKLY